MTVRPATPSEEKAVFAFFEEFRQGATQDLFADADLWIVDRTGSAAVCMASIDLAGWDEAPEGLLVDADHIGLRIGTLEGDDFHLDLQGAILLSGEQTPGMVRVNEQSTRMALYGKDVLGPSILHYDRGLRKGDACIVVNPRWEAIAIGEVIGPLKGKGAAVKPLHDLGTYLRDQQGEEDMDA